MKQSEVHKFNQEKLEACYKYILDWICDNGDNISINMDDLEIVNIIFIADIEHLNKYGRAITGMNYYFIDGEIEPSRRPSIGPDLKSHEEHMGYFSESDIEIIDMVLDNRLDLKFGYTMLPSGELTLDDLPICEEVMQDLREIKGICRIVC